MLKRMLAPAIVVGVIVLSGCNQTGGGKSPSGQAKDGGKALPGRVAIVDLSKIAEDIGHRVKIEEASQMRDRNLRLRVQVEEQSVQTKLRTLANDLGKRPEPKGARATEDEQKLIDAWEGKIQQLKLARQKATNDIRQAYNRQRQADQQAVRVEVTKMRDAIKPLAERIAKAKGLDVVLNASSVLVHGAAVDITSEVYDEVHALQKAGTFPTVKPAEAWVPPPQATTAPAGAGAEPKNGPLIPK